jgi:FkbM family methyltransferase
MDKKEFQVGRYKILMPMDHALPDYQAIHPLYDKFLPFLVSNISNLDWTIDVGANVGDTLFAILNQKADAKVLCIEADAPFFNLLKTNIANNQDLIETSNLKISAYLVGTGNFNGALSGRAGTKNLVLSDPQLETSTNSFLSLDRIIQDQDIDPARIKILKVDTDGFDFDVITSGKDLLSQQKPLIYFENQFSNDFQRNGYSNMYAMLNRYGYKKFYVFDNFGALMIKTTSIEIIDSLNTYLDFQNSQKTTRTIYYYDILCAVEDDIELCDRSIADYHAWIDTHQVMEISPPIPNPKNNPTLKEQLTQKIKSFLTYF